VLVTLHEPLHPSIVRLSVRIPLLVAASVVAAAATVTAVSAWRTNESLRDQAARHLVALREARSEALRRYVDVVEQRVATITTSASTLYALTEFGVAVRRIDDTMAGRHETLKRSYAPDRSASRTSCSSPEAAW
jgi:hypothetical protein